MVSFDDVDDMVKTANDTHLGLAAYVISGNIGTALSIAERVEAGVVGINRGFISEPAAPFGGFKQSGIGREGGDAGIEEFLESKYIAVEW